MVIDRIFETGFEIIDFSSSGTEDSRYMVRFKVCRMELWQKNRLLVATFVDIPFVRFLCRTRFFSFRNSSLLLMSNGARAKSSIFESDCFPQRPFTQIDYCQFKQQTRKSYDICILEVL